MGVNLLLEEPQSVCVPDEESKILEFFTLILDILDDHLWEKIITIAIIPWKPR